MTRRSFIGLFVIGLMAGLMNESDDDDEDECKS